MSPDKADEHCRDQVRQEQAEEADSAQGSGATGVPGEKTKESVKQEHRHGDCAGLPPAEASTSREHENGRGNERNPSEQAEHEAAAREHWMPQRRLVLEFESAKHDRAGDDQRL